MFYLRKDETQNEKMLCFFNNKYIIGTGLHVLRKSTKIFQGDHKLEHNLE